MDTPSLAGRIDLAFLKVKAGSSVQQLRAAVEQVQRLGLRSLCVPPVLAGTVKKNYHGLKVSAVVSYPLGTDSLAAKVFACSELLEQHIDELDVVLDLFALVNDNRRKLELEARELADATRQSPALVKAIIETPILSAPQIRWVTEVLCNAGIGCVKTSTGYGREPTKVEHVALIREVVAGGALIKASGGIRAYADAQMMIEAGADIIGASDAAALLQPA